LKQDSLDHRPHKLITPSMIPVLAFLLVAVLKHRHTDNLTYAGYAEAYCCGPQLYQRAEFLSTPKQPQVHQSRVQPQITARPDVVRPELRNSRRRS
jgi:hypothetical protein